MSPTRAKSLAQISWRSNARRSWVYAAGRAVWRAARELADVLGLSAERVRQIEHCALERMRELADGAADERPVISAPCQ